MLATKRVGAASIKQDGLRRVAAGRLLDLYNFWIPAGGQSERGNLMNYLSNNNTISLDESMRNHRTEILLRLYRMEFNVIPSDGKQPCLKWEHYQTRRVNPKELRQWLSGKFPTRDGLGHFRPKIHNFEMLTGEVPWSDDNPGIIVVDSDDAEAEELVRERCPSTPMVQITGSGNKQFVYRRPSIEYVAHIGNTTKLRIDGKQYNLDIRGDGGLVMCPGSIHPRTHKMYEEVQPWTMDLLKKAPVYDPTWLPNAKGNRSRSFSSAPADIDSADHDSVISEVELSIDEREEQARLYLARVPGTQEGNGADKKCTALTMKLLYGLALPVDFVQELLSDWGQKPDQLNKAGGFYPWTEAELARKIEWCLGQGYDGEVGDKLNPIRDFGELEPKVEEIVGSFDVGPKIDAKNHLEIAERFFRDCFVSDAGPTLIYHQSTWHQWIGTRYDVIAEDDIKARLWKWLATCRVWQKDKQVAFKPSRNVVSGVMDALKAEANEPSTLEAPCWLTSGPPNIIAFENGLLDVERCLAGHGGVLSHSPDWFSPNCLPHSFDATAACPQWFDFLNDVFDGDEERISALQQWFGYNLTSDNRQHKIAMLIGPPRSGKGTTMAVMGAMLGRHNIASTSLASLGGRFGLEPLVGKMSALIDEGHLGKFSDNSLVLERLKAISGGSEQTVDRKGIAALSSIDLKVRFTMAVNELPRLSDSSAALRSRLLIIPYFKTYEGKEDFDLVDRLLKEVSGITNWALEGLRQLKANGRFKTPSAGEKIMRDFVYLSSPVKAFIDECCELGPDQRVTRQDLRVVWQHWCEENGHVAGSRNDFGRKLRAVVPTIEDERSRCGGSRKWCYVGVGLKPDGADFVNVRNMVS